jgi:hypothetical protein
MLSLIDPHEPYETGQPKDPSKLELLRLTKGSLKLGLGCVTLCDVVWRVNNLQTRDIQDMQDTEQQGNCQSDQSALLPTQASSSGVT